MRPDADSTGNNSSNSSSSRRDGGPSEPGRRRGTTAAARKKSQPATDSALPQVAEVVLIEPKAPPPVGPKRTPRRESKPSAQNTKPNRNDKPTTSGGSRGSAGRSDLASSLASTGGGVSRAEKSPRAASKVKDLPPAGPSAPKYNVKPVKPGPADPSQQEPSRRKSRRSENEVKPRSAPKQSAKQSGKQPTAKQRASEAAVTDPATNPRTASKQSVKKTVEQRSDNRGPSAAGRMSKTLQRELELKSKSGSNTAGASKPGRLKKARIPEAPQYKDEQPVEESLVVKKLPLTPVAEPVGASELWTKPSTKICIRWLPADLPEHVFWRSAEPALPWFDPAKTGSISTRDRETLSALVDDELDSADETVTEDTTPTTKPTPGERVLPVADTQNVSVEVYESENLSRLDEQPYWRQFVCGKQHKSKTKADDPSRAYILFAEAEEAAHFYRHFHGHAFGKNGSVHRAMVELAPFQHVAWSLTSTITTDQCSLEGTIEKDAHFVAFLKTLGNGGGSSQSSEESAVVNSSSAGTTGIQQKPRVSYAAATAASGKGHGEPDKVGNKVTPLIEHLRKIKTGSTKPPPTVSRKVEASGGSLAKPTSSKKQGRKKAAVKEPPSSSSSVPATAKRSRRRKRE